MNVDSGLIVHTLHGPGTAPTELNMAALNALAVDDNKTCGDFMTDPNGPVFLPWCGSNRNVKSGALSDASSWTFVRQDTVNNSSAIQPVNDVVCEASNNKRYGLIFNNAYMNKADNLGCMYALDGDTGNRTGRGCGVSQNPGFSQHTIDTEAQGACPLTDDAADYLADFDQLLQYTYNGQSKASIAGSLICSLPKSKFDVWVEARKNINLGATTWPLNEFVLWNWDTYSAADLAAENVITGIYYLSNCAPPRGGSPVADGNRAEAQSIADLYKKWTGVDLPVVNLSNAELHNKSDTPFSCS
ncbi:MAG: hypothetical protein WA790_05540 [Sulfitobacter sp.]